MKKKLSLMLLLTLALNLGAAAAFATVNGGDCGEQAQSTEVSILADDERPW